MNPEVFVPREAIAAFCKANGICRLSLFESALNDRFRPESGRLAHDVSPRNPTVE